MLDFGDKKITVNCVAPGGIKTDMYQKVCKEYIPNGENLNDEEVDEVTKNPTPFPTSFLKDPSPIFPSPICIILTAYKTVRQNLESSPPSRSPNRYRTGRLFPRLPRRRMGKRQDHRNRWCSLHVNGHGGRRIVNSLDNELCNEIIG